MLTDGALTRRPEPRLSLAAGATLRAYIEDLRAVGVPVWSGRDGAPWAAFDPHAVRQVPSFHVGRPDPPEIDRMLRRTGALVAAYVAEPDEQRAANAWLYLCSDAQYSLRKLAPAVQRNVRRALRDLTIAPLTTGELFRHGGPAFCDTRRRTGVQGDTIAGFQRSFAQSNPTERPGRAYLGAWKDGQLAAFLTCLHVDDWVELGCYSMDSMLCHRPNDGLLYTALSHYLTQQKCRVVSFGLSSIQADSNIAGLHRFKRKLGFDVRPVHRAFVLHPALRPLANRVTLTAAQWTAHGVLRLWSGDRRLKKLGGMLACMLGTASTMHAAEPGTRDTGEGRSCWRRQSPCTT